MSPAQLCQVWNVTTSVSAIGAFTASNKPLQRTLSCLRNASRDIRLLVADQPALGPSTTTVALNALSASQPAATPSQDTTSTASQLCANVKNGQLDLAIAEFRKLQSSQTYLEPDLVEELISGQSYYGNRCAS